MIQKKARQPKPPSLPILHKATNGKIDK